MRCLIKLLQHPVVSKAILKIYDRFQFKCKFFTEVSIYNNILNFNFENSTYPTIRKPI